MARFHPAKILDWAEVADGLLDEPRTADVGLLTAWVAWEALRMRTLAVILGHQGWTREAAYQGLHALGAWSTKSYSGIFEAVTGRNPAQTSGLAQYWRSVSTAEAMRGRLVHGFSADSPKAMTLEGRHLVQLVSDVEWLKPVKVPTLLGDRGSRMVAIGDVYQRFPALRGLGRRSSPSELARSIRATDSWSRRTKSSSRG